jgi:hypothetical protein
MTLADLARISEIVAALGIIASLIYVGYQIRETRKAVRAATAQARTDLGVQLISSRYTSNISDLLVKSLEQPEELSQVERYKLKSFFYAHVRHCQNLFYQQEQGLLDEYFSIGVAHVTTHWVRHYAWAKEDWQDMLEEVPPSFRDFINTELKHQPSGNNA